VPSMTQTTSQRRSWGDANISVPTTKLISRFGMRKRRFNIDFTSQIVSVGDTVTEYEVPAIVCTSNINGGVSVTVSSSADDIVLPRVRRAKLKQQRKRVLEQQIATFNRISV
jgi:hypothetical protein